jgi:hypothetical protein
MPEGGQVRDRAGGIVRELVEHDQELLGRDALAPGIGAQEDVEAFLGRNGLRVRDAGSP